MASSPIDTQVPAAGPALADAAGRRAHMVALINRRGIRSAPVLRAMGTVPREWFVDTDQADRAYDDRPLPIGHGQTISQPCVVAAMVEAAEVRPGDTVLEVGAGCGYAAAVLGQIARQVCAIEQHPALAEAARQRLQALGYRNIDLRTGDGTRGWPDDRLFDAIVVSAGAPVVPRPLLAQLAPGGRLVMPVGGCDGQRLVKLSRSDAGGFERQDLGAVSFVPLVGGRG